MPLSDPSVSAGSSVWPWLRAAVVGAVAVAWAVAAHVASAHPEPSSWGAALALAPAVAAATMALWGLPMRWLGMLGVALMVVGLVFWWPALTARVAQLFFLEQTGVYLLMGAVFGRTLRGPGESLVTQMARRVHGGVLSPAQQAYTRKVTLGWSVFFAAMALCSTLLFLLCPIEVWSTFANLLGGPLIGLMFVGEYLLRRMVLPHEEQATMRDAIRAWKSRNAEKAP